MIRAGVIGYPIEHSLSPIIHNFWLKKFNISGSYDRILVKPEELGNKIKELAKSGYAGINVTVPHKENIIKYLDEITEQAEAIGAVNTVTFKNGKMIGENTDKFGFWFSLQSNGLENYTKGGKAVVLGIGGAARSIIANLTDKESVVIVHRSNPKKAEKLIDDFDGIFKSGVITPWEWEHKEEVFAGADLLVNATSLGMKNQPPLSLHMGGLTKDALVYDVVYNPLETELIKMAVKKKYKVMGGLDMLLGQAMPAFTEWFGQQPGTISQELKTELLKALEGR